MHRKDRQIEYYFSKVMETGFDVAVERVTDKITL